MGKKRVVIVGEYLQGIYPRGDNSVVADLLAPAFLKASADADPEICEKYEFKILNAFYQNWECGRYGKRGIL